jgi:cephalosporin hydroxylase
MGEADSMTEQRRLCDQNEFRASVDSAVAAQGADPDFRRLSAGWMVASAGHRYSYHFSWLGLPIIQYPQDIVAVQELVWRIRPTLIVETGIARGGSMTFLASLMALLDATDEEGDGRNVLGRRVLGVDIEIRPWNRDAVESHPLARYIHLIEGSSTDPGVIATVHAEAARHERVLVLLDSNHTHDHVLGELRAYASLVSVGSYCVVFDTVIDHLPPEALFERPWSPGNSPGSAVREFLASDGRFVVDDRIDAQLMLSVAPGGYLRRVA